MMAKEGSVAPKERVNIVYRPATGDVKEDVELPLRVLVVGDFTLQKDERAIEDRKPINIDKDNFNDVLDAQKLNLKTVVQNKLSDEPDAQMGISLDFKNIRDFEPDAIVQKIPELKKLMDLREALKALKGPLGNIPEFRKKVQELVQDESVRARLLKELGIEG
jgi:type VI secretion system protein ImpB